MKLIIYISLIGILFGCQSNNKYDSRILTNIEKKFIGKYEISGFNSGVTLELDEIGNFTHENQMWGCTGGGEVRRIRGKFKIDSNKLILIPKSLIDINYFGFDIKNLEKDSIEYYSSDSTYLKTDFQIIEWDSIVYLLSEERFSNWGYEQDENDYEDFAGYYNSGYEPQTSGSYFVKRKKDSNPKNDLDISILPNEYQPLFLREPIIAKIIEVKEVELDYGDEKPVKKKQFKLNKGKENGVFNKMEFYGEDGCCIIKIINSEEGYSYGRIFLCFDYQAECGTGDVLSTAYKRREL